MKEKHLYNLLIIVCVVLVISLVALPMGAKEVSVTGYATAQAQAQAGGVYVKNLKLPELWKGFYGNLTGMGNDTSALPVEVNGSFAGDVTVFHLDLPLEPCNDTEVYAGLNEVPRLTNESYINSISAAIPPAVDQYLGFSTLPSPDFRSATSIMDNFTRFDVGFGKLLMFTTQLLPRDKEWHVGLLEDFNRNFSFVANVSVGHVDFQNGTSDYQIILPVPAGVNNTWYFFQDITDNCSFPDVIDNITSTNGTVPVPEQDLESNGTEPDPVPTKSPEEVPPRCGNEICERLENCKTCPIDCGECPKTTEIVYEDRYVIGDNKTKTLETVDFVKYLIGKNTECNELRPLISKADGLIEDERYTDALLLLNEVIETCKHIIELSKPKFQHRFPDVVKDYNLWLFIVIVVCILIILLLLLIISYQSRSNKIHKALKAPSKGKEFLKRWR